MKFLVIVNEAPWSGGLGLMAWRLVRAMLEKRHEVAAVYFRGEGVYTALRGEVSDGGAPDLYREWLGISASGVPLLLCSTDARRRMPETESGAFREAGLPEVISLLGEADRVISL